MVWDRSDSDDVTRTICQRVARREGVSLLELPPLYSAIDPDLVGSLPEGARLTFPYHGYEVAVDGGGDVTVRNPTG